MAEVPVEVAVGVALLIIGAAGKWLVGLVHGWFLRRKVKLGGTYLTLCVWDGEPPVKLKGVARLRQPSPELKGKARDHEREAIFSWRGRIDWNQRIVAGYCVPKQKLNRGRSSFVLDIDGAPARLHGSQVAYLSSDRQVVAGSYEMRRMNTQAIKVINGDRIADATAFLEQQSGLCGYAASESQLLLAACDGDSISGAVMVDLDPRSAGEPEPAARAALDEAFGASRSPFVVAGLAVKSACRRTGLATRLLCAAASEARRRGADVALVAVGDPADGELTSVIELLGFAPVKDGSQWWRVSLTEPLDHRVVSYKSGKWMRLKRWLRLDKETTGFDAV